MTEITRRERLRAATELEIREHARQLLVDQGQHAVTLRAIARELGVTAPALYRYYNSREDLLRQVGDDICLRLAAELTTAIERVDTSDLPGRVLAACRRLRTWALEHPKEFELVFASRHTRADSDPSCTVPDQFGQIFLALVANIVTTEAPMPAQERFPPELEAELIVARTAVVESMAGLDIVVPPQMLELTAVYALLNWWIRVYGHVALEVFGRFPFAVNNAERLFESMLTELVQDMAFLQESTDQQAGSHD
ncbi:TetR/AcrR family transcriptional regulator [Actinoalloteichus hymeniacidonis]|uniref:Transcriptional regulator, TetR family n=1 Tax=Actinoalloteichus hymeniacidonis TaxID=340345 RepID=A0AAC9HVD9_9PSEU|nr:TetR/AcrR family transcriptional regulator [Actinoalloteichus hymeniacidonis]AOS66168.1 transcriptional regulator, TetR family [Actinoalloteichus hymeniacidonis]MBB5905729.1 AcrR family transcriptional regulator [Actinoalloteichus hymeniacidonis]